MNYTELIGKYIKHKTNKIFKNHITNSKKDSKYAIFVKNIQIKHNKYYLNNDTYVIDDIENCEVVDEKDMRHLNNIHLEELRCSKLIDVDEINGIRLYSIIRKKGYTPFYNGRPTLVVKSITPLRKRKDAVMINNHVINIDCLVVIDENEEKTLNLLFDSCVISDFDITQYTNPCISSTSGEPKMQYPSKKIAKEKLFHMRIRYPEKYFEAYLCPNCNKYHVGKPTKTELNEI